MKERMLVCVDVVLFFVETIALLSEILGGQKITHFE
jgi:hypothetical protein